MKHEINEQNPEIKLAVSSNNGLLIILIYFFKKNKLSKNNLEK